MTRYEQLKRDLLQNFKEFQDIKAPGGSDLANEIVASKMARSIVDAIPASTFNVVGEMPCSQINVYDKNVGDLFTTIDAGNLFGAVTLTVNKGWIVWWSGDRFVKVYEGVQGGGSSVTVDQSLDITSANPIANAPVAAAIVDVNRRIDELEPGENVQSDWSQDDDTSPDFIKNKPETMPPSSHNHSASDITSGSFPIARGGTGATTAANARANLGAEASSNKVSSWSSTTNNTRYPTEKLVKDSLNEKYAKPSGGIPKSDLASDVKTSLGKADSALQQHQDISGKADNDHKHGTLHSSFARVLPSYTDDGSWKTNLGVDNNGFVLLSLRGNSVVPDWFVRGYASGIAFGGGDSKGVISIDYDSSKRDVKFAGGAGNAPGWYWTLSGSNGVKYTLPVNGGTLALASEIPAAANNATLTVKMNGSSKGTFTANASADKTIDLGTVITDISSKADNTPTFSEASSRAILAGSGETMPTILGKIKKFFTDLKTVAFTGNYSDLSGKPTIPTVNNATLTVKMNGSSKGTFTANASADKTIDLGTVITAHQDISGKANRDGSNASGTWGINISGNAATATSAANQKFLINGNGSEANCEVRYNSSSPSVFLDATSTKRGIWAGSISGGAAGKWAVEIDSGNNVTLNGVADMVDGYHISVGSTPGTNTSTIYFF